MWIPVVCLSQMYVTPKNSGPLFWGRHSQGSAQGSGFTSPWHAISTLPFSAVLVVSITHPSSLTVVLAMEGMCTAPFPI